MGGLLAIVLCSSVWSCPSSAIANGDSDDDERLDVLLSSSLLVRRYSSFSLKSAILMYEMLGFFLLFIEIFVSVGSSKWFSFV